MPGFFEALENFKPTPPKKHYLTFGETKIEVSLQQYLEVTRAGIENFEYKDKKITRKKRIPVEQRQPLMHKADKGYKFYKKDPFWVKNIGKEGYVWQIK
jgi:hypothetical protein